jgi:endonuclease IV
MSDEKKVKQEHGEVGCHCSVNELDAYDTKVFKTVQVFIRVPNTSAKIKATNLQKVKDFVSQVKNLYVHTPYVERFQDEKRSEEMYIEADQIGAKGLVYHLPKDEIKNIIPIIKTLVDIKLRNKGKCKILMEQPAYKATPNTTYESPAKLDALIDACAEFSHDDLGFVLDTAHIYAAGVNLRTLEEAKTYLNSIKNFNRIDLLHLNGNCVHNAICKDKHAVPFSTEDKIWNGIPYLESGCRAFIVKFIKSNKDIIFEVKKDYQIDEILMFLQEITN